MSAILTTEPLWVREDTALAVHQRQLAEHGGLAGVRDAGLLSSALARPQHLYHYRPTECGLADLAAAYGFGIARNHPFSDGNKRTAWVITRMFCILNGWDIAAPQEDKYTIMMALAGGDIDEAQFAEWLARWLAVR